MKLIRHVTLSVTIFVSSLASARPSPEIDSPLRYVVEKVILTEGEREVCVADTTGKSDLVPYFMHTSTKGSSSDVGLRPCDASEVMAIQQMASVTERKEDVAAFPAFVVGAVLICTVAVGIGAWGGVSETPIIGGIAMTTPAAMVTKGAWWMGSKLALGLGAAMVTCGAVGYYGAKGLKYLLSAPNPAESGSLRPSQ